MGCSHKYSRKAKSYGVAVILSLASFSLSVRITLFKRRAIHFEQDDLVFRRDEVLPGHSIGMRFTAFDHKGGAIDSRVYYSTGGGFIMEEGESASSNPKRSVLYPFDNVDELLRLGEEKGLPIHLIMLTNEMTWRPLEDIRDGIWKIWIVMQECATRGLITRGMLPGGLDVQRRAAEMARRLENTNSTDPLVGMDWLNVWAIVKAVNAARMAMKETGGHKVSLDQVIRTMYQTGLDMQTRYKETALDGLALNVIEC